MKEGLLHTGVLNICFLPDGRRSGGSRRCPDSSLHLSTNRRVSNLHKTTSEAFGVNAFHGFICTHDSSQALVGENQGIINCDGQSHCTVKTNKGGTISFDESAWGTVELNEAEVRVYGSSKVYVDRQQSSLTSTGHTIICDIDARVITPASISTSTVVGQKLKMSNKEVLAAHFKLPETVTSLSSFLNTSGEIDIAKIKAAGGIISVENAKVIVTFTATNLTGKKMNVSFEVQQRPDSKGNISPMFVMTEAEDIIAPPLLT